MTRAPSRRSVLGGVAASAVIGWSSATRSWATTSAHHHDDVARLPDLDGSVETSAAAVAPFSRDFGRLKEGTPWAVLRPGSVQDVVRMVCYARDNGLKIAMNGRSGSGDDLESHSSYGQAEVPGGISIDARSLSRIEHIGSHHAVVQAGVTWGMLTDAALLEGRTPPALTDYLHLSIGGTLSVGGIGGTVQKYGLQVDNVDSIDVVTGTGRLVTASATSHPALFHAVLSGAGQCGIIVRATVRLIEAPARATVFSLFYDDLATYRADSEQVLADGRFDAQAGEMLRKPDGSGWRYKMEAAAYYSGNETPDRSRLLSGLHDVRSAMVVEDGTYRDYMFRLDAYEAFLKENGYWDQPKPWLSLFLPASRVQEFMTRIERTLTQDSLGGGFLLFYPYYTSKIREPLAVQPDEPVAYLFDLLRFPAPGDPHIDEMLRENRDLYDRCVGIGGKSYLVGAVPDLTREDWERRFGRMWRPFRVAKRYFDPDGILTPGQRIFT